MEVPPIAEVGLEVFLMLTFSKGETVRVFRPP